MSDIAQQVMPRLAALARVTDEPGRVTRTFASPAMRRANELVAAWMCAAGMKTRVDAIGNLIGHYAGEKSGAKILLLGSHLDTVRNAGKFDGPLGVVLAIACIAELRRRKIRLPFAIEVIGFADEEGVRYQTAYLGSKVLAGTFNPADLERRDTGGITLAEAIRKFGGDPQRLKSARLDPKKLLGYVEAHIEQGPVLEEMNLAVGIVSVIAGQSRFKISFVGRAGHAGTTPMASRQDALCAAAEYVLAVEACGRNTPGLVATVGQAQVEPNTSNVIPGAVNLTLDVRHQKDSARQTAVARLTAKARQIARARGVKVVLELVQQTPSVPCDRNLSGLLRRAARKHQAKFIALPSGAGHDAAVMAGITPAAMLFVRCKGGVSHHPAESVKPADVQVALAAMKDFIRLLAASPRK